MERVKKNAKANNREMRSESVDCLHPLVCVRAPRTEFSDGKGKGSDKNDRKASSGPSKKRQLAVSDISLALSCLLSE